MGRPLGDKTVMKDYLICVDSDGCAMDTMTIKHVKCFGPDIITTWNLESYQDAILERWNTINLYSKTRGINRFSGLCMMLSEIDAQYTSITDLADLRDWVEHTDAFSEKKLMEEIERKPESDCLNKALQWSRKVNIDIDNLKDDEKVNFAGVKEALELSKTQADVAIVSSANRKAMEEEWIRCKIMNYVDYPMAQDVGTKEKCLLKMIAEGYNPATILMIGDAMGDYKAAKAAGVRFYPIKVGHETESWQHFTNQVYQQFISGNYTPEAEQAEYQSFVDNFVS